MFRTFALAAVFLVVVGARGLFGDEAKSYEGAAGEVERSCDPGPELSGDERRELFDRLQESRAGRQILADFVRQYGGFSNLAIQWDSVSYSQVVSVTRDGRAPAGASELGNGVCVHLTKRLPAIEHVADLAHELAHATRLERRVLRGEVANVDEFVHARLTARGGEADAFSEECKVKHELLGSWDEFCSPYATGEDSRGFNTGQVIKDLYSGRLSASLTGETYPVMLARQYRAMLAKKVAKQARLPYATSPYARQ